MERNIQRINGIKMDVCKLTNEELEANMARIQNTHVLLDSELEILGVESARRYFAEDLATDGLARVIELRPRDPNQLPLFETPDPAA